MTVVLWDVDGTLLEAPSLGAFGDALSVVAPEVTGLPDLPPGLTDKGRAMAILQWHGLEQRLCPSFLAELAFVTAARVETRPPEVRPGYKAIVRELTRRGTPQGLLTGNTRPRAFAKLASSSLGTDWIEPELVFTGEDEADRADLARRARKSVGDRPIVIIGDTNEDARAARAAGARMCWAEESSNVHEYLSEFLVGSAPVSREQTEGVQ